MPVTLVHVPIDPATLHAWHWFLQSLLQHTPSTQKLLVHSLLAPQATPFAFFGAHEVTAQYVPEAHAESLVQVGGHDPRVPQFSNGEHDGRVPCGGSPSSGTQTPR